jgi:bifunctional DNase/RNase
MGNASTEVARAKFWIRPYRATIASCFVLAAFALGCGRSEPTEVTIRGEPPCCAKHQPKANVPSTPPAGFEPVEVAGVAGTGHGHAVVLANQEWALPIFVGESEGLSIELRLSGARFHRPLTHDLLEAMLRELDGHIESVRVERDPHSVFRSVIVLSHGGRHSELDARTSDAIALALGSHVPIFVRSTMLQRDGVRLDELHHHERGEAKPESPGRPTGPESVRPSRATMTL